MIYKTNVIRQVFKKIFKYIFSRVLCPSISNISQNIINETEEEWNCSIMEIGESSNRCNIQAVAGSIVYIKKNIILNK